jgi:hypothetical protein
MISPFTGDFAHHLNVAAADYADSCACTPEHASVDAFEEKQWFEPLRQIGSLWFGVRAFVCVKLAAAEWPRKRTEDREHSQ